MELKEYGGFKGLAYEIGNYTPVDLEYIFEKTDKLLELEDKFLEIYQKNNESQKKNIARIVRQIVKNNIEKGK